MSDPTKKSIVINKSFLTGSSGSSEPAKNKSRKQSRPKIPDEVIKPSKLKQMLLDKINAKRRAELNVTSATPRENEKENTKHKKHKGFGLGLGLGNDYGRAGSSEQTGGIDKEKEAKIFSDEFKKSLSFLDKYIQAKNTEKADKRQHSHSNSHSHSKTLKRANGTSLNEDILKSLHNNNNNNRNHNTSPHKTQLNVNTQLYQNPSTTYASNLRQRSVSPSRAVSPTLSQRGVSFATQQQQQPPTYPPPPGFQKIQLNIPKVNTSHVQSPKHDKITLALGKPSPSPTMSTLPGTTMTDAGNLIYTELPPELMPTAPIPTPMLTILPDPISAPIIETFASSSSPSPSPSPSPSRSPSPSSISSTTLSTSTPTFSPIKLTDDKPYGCLKGGRKPTFRLYNKTIKHSHSHSHSDPTNTGSKNESVVYSERQQKLNDLRNKHIFKPSSGSSSYVVSGNDELENEEKGEKGEKRENEINNSKSKRATKIRKRLRKTITKRFRLGKQGNVVGVLIKNNDTRKKIQKEHGLLKNKNLSDVKKYLVEQKLMKIGSTAPPNIIRKIYEDSVLTGEVENVGKDVILHNFLEHNKPW